MNITKEKGIVVAVIILSIFLLQSCGQKKGDVPADEKTKPNIVLFLADDMTWRDCEPYGNPDVITPNIQKLADEGMCFDNMFTATAMCAPTRQQIMTGLFPVRSGAYPNHSQVYDGVKSLAHYFRDLGYHVALIGKQHYGPDTSFPMEYLGGRQHDDGNDGADIHLGTIKPIVGNDKPFFLIIAQNQPHSPWNRGNPSRYDANKITVPEYMIDCAETRKGLRQYYAEITYADSLLGKTLDYVETAGKTDNTISIFTSEQGYSYPFGKWTNYDLGLKTSFIVKWPGNVEPNSRNSAITQYVDVVPTLLDAVGGSLGDIDVGIPDAEGNRGFDGYSFLDVLLGKTKNHRDYTYGVQTTRGIISGSESYPIRSVSSGRYKYIRNLSYEANFYNLVTVRDKIYKTWLKEATGEKLEWVKRYKKRPFEELYDLENDPYEKNNIARKPEMKNIRMELASKLNSWMRQQGDEGIATEMAALDRQQGDRQWKSHDEKLRE